MRARSSRSLLAATLSIGLLLAGCSGSAETDTGDEAGSRDTTADEPADHGDQVAAEGDGGSAVVAAAVEQSASVTSARTRFSSVVSTPQGDVDISGEGISGPEVAQITMTLGGASAAAFGADEVELEVRLLGGVMYQRFPQLIQQIGADADWLSFDLASLGPEFEGVLEQAQQADPAESLQTLRDVVDVTEAGGETVNGTETIRYEGTMTLRDALESSGVDPATMSASSVDIGAPMPVTVWIDGDGLVRRYETSMDIDGMAATTSFEVLEYDVEVTVEAPPADRTVDFGELMGGAGEG